jgi:hypothetical protein
VKILCTIRADVFSEDSDSVYSVSAELMQTVPAETVSAVSEDSVSGDSVSVELV